MKYIFFILSLGMYSTSFAQQRYVTLKYLSNSSAKYWDGMHNVSWKMDKNGVLKEYYTDRNYNRMPPAISDVRMGDLTWAIKGDTLLELALPVVYREYRILKLNEDTLIIKSINSRFFTDTLQFIKSVDQKTPIITFNADPNQL